MDVKICFADTITAEDAHQLSQLALLIEEECDIEVSRERKELVQGERDGGLVIAIAVVSLGLAAYQSLIATLQYWDSRQPKYSISKTSGNTTQLIENLSSSQAEDEFRKLRTKSAEPYIQIQISQN